MNLFLNGKKLPTFYKKYFVKENLWQIQAFLGKKLKGLVRGTWNLACRNFRSCFEKSQKTTISSRQPFTVNFAFEIYKYFPNIFITSIIKIICIWFLRAMFNWSPQFYSHPCRSLFESQLILWQLLVLQKTFSTRTQLYIESETAKENTYK